MLFRQALERDLQQTQNVCIKLQQQGMYPEALKYMERCLTLTSESRHPRCASPPGGIVSTLALEPRHRDAVTLPLM